MITDIIRTELETLREKYGDERRTEITGEVKEFEVEDLIADEEMVVTLSHAGYIKRLPMDTYRKQHRGGVGIRGAATKDGDFLEHIFVATAHQNILFFTDLGKCYTLKVHQIPEARRQSAGRAVVNLLRLSQGENITAYVTVRPKTGNQETESADAGESAASEFVFMATQQGIVKKTALASFANTLSSGIIAVNLDDGDKLIGAQVTEGTSDVILVTHKGTAIRFSEKDVRSLGRNTRGVRGIELGADDFLAQMVIVDGKTEQAEETTQEDDTLLNRHGKWVWQAYVCLRLSLPKTRWERRYCYWKVCPKRRSCLPQNALQIPMNLFLLVQTGMSPRMAVGDIRRIGRNTQGVRIMTLQADEKLVDAAKIELSSALLADDSDA